MKIEIKIPPREMILSGGKVVCLATRGKSWSERQLGDYAKDTGVYVIHHAGSVKYVGKTNRPSMSFGMRLRREFQEKASQRRHIYPKLEKLTVPPPIYVFFFGMRDVCNLVKTEDAKIDDVGKIEIFEQALLHSLKPEWQK